MNQTPNWKHDCPKCKYLGSMLVGERTADWYECEGFDRCVIARFNNEGSDYWSMPTDMVTDDRYLKARRASNGTRGIAYMQVLAQFMLKQRS